MLTLKKLPVCKIWSAQRSTCPSIFILTVSTISAVFEKTRQRQGKWLCFPLLHSYIFQKTASKGIPELGGFIWIIKTPLNISPMFWINCKMSHQLISIHLGCICIDHLEQEAQHQDFKQQSERAGTQSAASFGAGGNDTVQIGWKHILRYKQTHFVGLEVEIKTSCHACMFKRYDKKCSSLFHNSTPKLQRTVREGSDTTGTFPFLVGKQTDSHFWKTHSKVTFLSECAWNSFQHAHTELGKEMPCKFCQWDVSKPLFFILSLSWCALSCPWVWRRRINKDRRLEYG